VNAHRLQWEQLPRAVQTTIESMLGARVVASVSGAGGYSPSLASRCDLDDGRRVFVKAASPAQNPETPGMLRREIDVTRRLPGAVPAPSLLHEHDDEEWVVAVLTYVDGRTPGQPWCDEDLRSVIEAARKLGEPPVPDSLRGLPSAAESLRTEFGAWRRAADAPDAAVLDEWSGAHLDHLVALESRWAELVAGDALVHLDIRSDNVLIEPGGRVVLVDWNHACIGAPWLDRLVMLPALALETGHDPDVLIDALGVDPHHDAVDTLMAALAGYFVERGSRPDPPGLPTVRAFQRAQAEVTLGWLRTRLGDPASQ